MKKLRKILSAILLTAMVAFAAGCTPEDEPNNGGNNNGETPETPAAPTGALGGVFSTNQNGGKVYFSQGNLQYQASTHTWRFANQQWDLIGEGNAHISSTYSGWIDLFGWGTSGWDNGNVYYLPTDYEDTYERMVNDGWGYGPTDGEHFDLDLTGKYANADWGVYNPISNGGNRSGLWRTLTSEEWEYVFHQRNTASGSRFAKAEVNEVRGIILLPDNWKASTYDLTEPDSNSADFEGNQISQTQWNSVFKPAGAVFLPFAQGRDHRSYPSSNNGYWSSFCGRYSNGAASVEEGNALVFTYGNIYTASCKNRYLGLAVRLVQEVP